MIYLAHDDMYQYIFPLDMLLFLSFFRLRDEAKTWLKVMGASQIDKVAFRDSYVPIGQRGLKHGHAVEFVSPYLKKQRAC